jgi:hypothetical protein
VAVIGGPGTTVENLVPLVELRLGQKEGIALLEREKITEIFGEQEFQALLAAGAPGKRAALGKVLKADLLVFLVGRDKPKPHVEVVVCETGRGVRLCCEPVPLTGKPKDDEEAIGQRIDGALRKRAERIRDICAVPPFVSNDLTYDDDYLKTAYAKLAEEALRGQAGLLIVELQESRALAQEIALAGGGVDRPLPLYLLGDYRHQGHGADRKAGIRLRVMRGERELASRQGAGLGPEAAARFVREMAAALVGKTMGVDAPVPDAKAESRQIAQRAENFFRVGSWDEAAALAEASLLLDGTQGRMHGVATMSLAQMAHRDAFLATGRDVARILGGIRSNLRGLEHFEAWYASPARPALLESLDVSASLTVNVCDWNRDAAALRRNFNLPDAEERLTPLRQQEQETLTRIVRTTIAGNPNDALNFLVRLLRGRPAKERFDRLLEFAAGMRSVSGGTLEELNLREAERRLIFNTVVELAEFERVDLGGDLVALESPAGQRFLDRLEAMDNPAMKPAAAALRKELAAFRRRKAAAAESAPAAPAPAERQPLRWEPITMGNDPAEPPFAFSWMRRWNGLIAGPPGADFAWRDNRLYLLDAPGHPKCIWRWKKGGPGITHVGGYDGQYCWLAVDDARMLGLVVVEPRTGQAWEIGQEAGLPVSKVRELDNPAERPDLWVVPVGPGRAIVVSWLGRVAVAAAKFDPGGASKVEVFFEARNIPEPGGWQEVREGRWVAKPRDIKSAYKPVLVQGFRRVGADGRPVCRVVLWYGPIAPLVVDPERREVVAMAPWECSHFPTPDEPITDAFYCRSEPRHDILLRRALPDFKPEIVAHNVPDGCIAQWGRKLLILSINGKQCWLLDPQAPPQMQLRVVADRVPWDDFRGLPALMRSNHYGLVLRHVKKNGKEYSTEFCRAVLDESP